VQACDEAKLDDMYHGSIMPWLNQRCGSLFQAEKRKRETQAYLAGPKRIAPSGPRRISDKLIREGEIRAVEAQVVWAKKLDVDLDDLDWTDKEWEIYHALHRH